MELEIKVMWCKGLAAFNFFQKLTIYTSVSIKCEDDRVKLTQLQKQEQKTPVDEEGDGNPEWNHTLMFDLRPLQSINSNFENLSVVFEFRHQGQLFGDKTIGEVRVPLSSLIDSIGIDVFRFVSYEVRTPEGKHNGVLDFSYKVLRKEFNLENNHNSQQLHWDHHNHDHGQIHHDHDHIHHDHGQILHHHHYQLDQSSSSNPEKIQYPRIDDLEDWSANNSTTLVRVDQWGPPPPRYQWGPPPPQPPHFHSPPPPPPPVVYPPPRNGDPHWGYYRPPNFNQPNGGCDGYHRW